MRRRQRPGGGGPVRAARRVVLVAVAGLTAGCAAVPGGPGGSPGDPSSLLVPPGYGTLRQDAITMTLRTGALQLKVTPLEEWMIRLTAPDTYDRLSELAAAHRAALLRDTGRPDARLFLVSFFSDEIGTTYDPGDVHLMERGRRHRPLAIRPVTSGWGTQRLPQRETRMAIYAFDAALSMDMGMVLEYEDVRNHQWDGILGSLEAEHGRARARAGTAGGS